MSGTAPILMIVLLLTLIGSGALLLVTIKYYWGERGVAPPSREERQSHRQAELALRAKQIEQARNSPVRPRNPSFWDNTKAR